MNWNSVIGNTALFLNISVLAMAAIVLIIVVISRIIIAMIVSMLIISISHINVINECNVNGSAVSIYIVRLMAVPLS